MLAKYRPDKGWQRLFDLQQHPELGQALEHEQRLLEQLGIQRDRVPP